MFFKALAIAVASASLVSGLAVRQYDDPKVRVYGGFPCNTTPVAEIPFDKCTEVQSDWVAYNLDAGTKCKYYWYANCQGEGPPEHTGPECFYFADSPVSVRCRRT